MMYEALQGEMLEKQKKKKSSQHGVQECMSKQKAKNKPKKKVDQEDNEFH